MFNPELKVRCWRPVFDGNEHLLDVFSEKELSDIGGGAAFTKFLKDRKLYAGPITTPKSIADALNGQNVVVIFHNESERESAHGAYQWLGLKKEAILFL